MTSHWLFVPFWLFVSASIRFLWMWMVVFLHVLTTESFCSVIFASHTMCMHVQKNDKRIVVNKNSVVNQNAVCNSQKCSPYKWTTVWIECCKQMAEDIQTVAFNISDNINNMQHLMNMLWNDRMFGTFYEANGRRHILLTLICCFSCSCVVICDCIILMCTYCFVIVHLALILNLQTTQTVGLQEYDDSDRPCVYQQACHRPVVSALDLQCIPAELIANDRQPPPTHDLHSRWNCESHSCLFFLADCLNIFQS